MTRMATGATAAALVLAVACHRGPELVEIPGESAGPASAAAAPSESAPPPADHLAPGELLEGSRDAFGVVLPRVLQVNGAFADVVYASARVPVHALVQYFRPRLVGGSLREGPEAATFEHVRARAAVDSSEAGGDLMLRIATAMDGTRVEIRDVTTRPAAPAPDESARWRRVGMTPDGRLADPHHME